MNEFQYFNPTRWIFGKDVIKHLGNEVKKYGQNVLLVYGGGSIKRNGVYNQVMAQLHTIEATVVELNGVEPNPRLTTVRKGVELCKNHNIDFILAVGGGSVIDCAKAIAVGAYMEEDVWNVMLRKVIPQSAVPIGTVLTLAATGSEMNSGSVITNWETKEKLGWGNPNVFPKFSICDPTYTMSVPKNHTAYGMIDIMTHVLEQYFHNEENTLLQDRYMESILRTVLETAPTLMNNLEDYMARETILFCGTQALNGSLQVGLRGDWASHNIEHAVSAVYDIPHAAGLAIVYPQWMSYVAKHKSKRFVQLATRVFDVSTEGKTDIQVAEEGIVRLKSFWSSLGAPVSFKELNITDEHFEDIAQKTLLFGEFGNFHKLNGEAVLEILRTSL